jgi:hypothetical protein
MPRGDGTGPNGMGPMTGRRGGFCARFGFLGFGNVGFGRRNRFNLDQGRGQDFRNRFRFWRQIEDQQEKNYD